MQIRLCQHQRLVALVLLLSVLVPAPLVLAGNPNPGVAPPNARPHGKSYAEWSAAWQSWVLAQPVAVNPILSDPTGAQCAQGQGSVWFLGAAITFTGEPLPPVTRTCTMPTGTALLFPILNGFEDNNGASGADIRSPEQLNTDCNKKIQDPATLFVTIDGRDLTNLKAYKIPERTFFFYILEDSLRAYIESLFPGLVLTKSPPPPGAVSCGYYVMLNPLAKGTHTLHFGGRTASFSVDATYTLNVVPAGKFKQAAGDHAKPKHRKTEHRRHGTHRH
jgi:hypothetical protein